MYFAFAFHLDHDVYHISFFFFNDTATTEIYTLSLHDALPILERAAAGTPGVDHHDRCRSKCRDVHGEDRKSTRLNSSHQIISYAVFCLKKKNKNITVYSKPSYKPTITQNMSFSSYEFTDNYAP